MLSIKVMSFNRSHTYTSHTLHTLVLLFKQLSCNCWITSRLSLLQGWEQLVLSKLKWNISVVTPLDFVKHLLVRLPIESVGVQEAMVDNHTKTLIAHCACGECYHSSNCPLYFRPHMYVQFFILLFWIFGVVWDEWKY